jgi:hypothetical protein
VDARPQDLSPRRPKQVKTEASEDSRNRTI